MCVLFLMAYTKNRVSETVLSDNKKEIKNYHD